MYLPYLKRINYILFIYVYSQIDVRSWFTNERFVVTGVVRVMAHGGPAAGSQLRGAGAAGGAAAARRRRPALQQPHCAHRER